ncbi:MAG: hypothetical protein ACR2QE_11220 [Acidimicrobiales bacterium]
MTVALASVNGNGTYQGCVPEAESLGLGGLIVAFAEDGSQPTLVDGRVADPAADVHVTRIDMEVEEGQLSAERDAAVLQVSGLDAAFAVALEQGHRPVEPFTTDPVVARPEGRLGPPDSLGWHSLMVPVDPVGPELTVYDVAIEYRLGAGDIVRGSPAMQWHVCLDDCRQRCPAGAGGERLAGRSTEWVTVFAAHPGEPWEVVPRMPG